MLYYVLRRRLPADESDIGRSERKAHVIQQLRMCEAFAAAGEDVRLVFPGEDGASWEFLSDYYGLSTRFELKAVSPLSQDYNFPNYPVPATDNGALGGWLLYAALSGEFDPGDVVYSRSLHAMRYFTAARKWGAFGDEVSVWFEQHQVDRAIDDRFVGSTADFYDQLDGVVCISETQREAVRRVQPVDPEKLFVAHDGVDRSAYEGLSTEGARDRIGIPLDEKVVMYTGHLYPSKGVETLVRAAGEFDARCYVVGGYDEDISRIAAEERVPESVSFTGFVPPSEVPLYQLSADVLVATVAADPDTDYFSPLKLFEYMAAGAPIVACRRGAYEEVLTDGRTALFVPPGSVPDLAAAVDGLLSDPELRADLGQRAREHVEQYDWRVRARRILAAIDGAARSRLTPGSGVPERLSPD